MSSVQKNDFTLALGKACVRWQSCAAVTDLGVPLKVPLSPYEIIYFRCVFMCLWFWVCALFSECYVSCVVLVMRNTSNLRTGRKGHT